MLVYTINGTMDDPGTRLTNSSISARPLWSTPPNARQPNSNNDPARLLQTNRGLVIEGFRTKNNLYGVFCSTVDNKPGIYLFRVTLSEISPTFNDFDGITISAPDLDMAFPSITYGGLSCDLGEGRSAEDLFIAFNYASPQKFPGNGVYYVNYKWEVSDAVILVEGQNNLELSGVNNPFDSRNRWGDYSDITTRGLDGEAFVSGYYIEQNGDPSTWISQIEIQPEEDELCPTTSITEREPRDAPVSALKAYPSPAIDYMTFEFEVKKQDTYRALIFDMEGRQVKHLRTSTLSPGTIKVGFNAAVLPAGQYQVVVEGKGHRAVLARPFTVVK
jgi:hypothetical protein